MVYKNGFSGLLKDGYFDVTFKQRRTNMIGNDIVRTYIVNEQKYHSIGDVPSEFQDLFYEFEINGYINRMPEYHQKKKSLGVALEIEGERYTTYRKIPRRYKKGGLGIYVFVVALVLILAFVFVPQILDRNSPGRIPLGYLCSTDPSSSYGTCIGENENQTECLGAEEADSRFQEFMIPAPGISSPIRWWSYYMLNLTNAGNDGFCTKNCVEHSDCPTSMQCEAVFIERNYRGVDEEALAEASSIKEKYCVIVD